MDNKSRAWFRPVHTLTARVQEIHTALRADGSPYWIHPLRCHDFLLTIWKEASFEAEIAMLFHDTLEDIEGGEAIIQDVLELSRSAWPDLDKAKAYNLICNLTAPPGIPKTQAIAEVEQRFRERRVEPEAYLLKSIDMMDNTSDLVSCYHRSSGNQEIRKHITLQRLQKYRGYFDAIRAGLRGNTDVWGESRVGMAKAMARVLNSVNGNLEDMEAVINRMDADAGKMPSDQVRDH